MSDRTVQFLENGRTVARGMSWDYRRYFSAHQDKDDTLTYTLDFSDWLGTDTISSVTTDGQFVTATPSNTTTAVTLVVSEVRGYPATLEVQITTAGGSKKTVRLRFYEQGGGEYGDYRD